MLAALRGYTAMCRARSASRRMNQFNRSRMQSLQKPLIPSDRWPALIDILSHGKKTDKSRADALKRTIAQTGPAKRQIYTSIFFKIDGDPRQDVVTSAIKTDFPQIADQLDDGTATPR